MIYNSKTDDDEPGVTNHILVIDDNEPVCEQIANTLAVDGHKVFMANNGTSAMKLLEENVFQAIITDLHHPGVSVDSMISYIKEHAADTQIITTTSRSSIDTAVEIMRKGAFDFIEKPVNFSKLSLIVSRALEQASLGHAFNYLRNEQPYIYRLNKILAESDAMKKVVDQVSKVAPTDVTVMLTGESGTGKSLVAGAIHTNSTRRDKTLVTVNCAALTETILESELFGHEKGSFTGAHKSRTGRIQQAHQGTLFLDEIGEMSLSTQAKILTAIEDKIIQRVGGSRQIRVDVRIVAATNRDLTKAVEDGSFREDLYYRLNVTHIHMPPLRDRVEDILPLARKFRNRVCRELGLSVVKMSNEAKKKLTSYHWPGNIRELRNVIERAVLFCTGPELAANDLSLAQIKPPEKKNAEPVTLNLEKLEKWAIETALEKTDYIQVRAAELLGISPRGLVYKLNKYDINHPRRSTRQKKVS